MDLNLKKNDQQLIDVVLLNELGITELADTKDCASS